MPWEYSQISLSARRLKREGFLQFAQFPMATDEAEFRDRRREILLYPEDGR